MYDDTLTTATILNVFTEEVQDRGGHVTDTIRNGRRIFVRSLLPHVGEVRPKDRLQGGISLQAAETELWLHPYLFRQVCRNGAVTAHSLESLHLERLDLYTPEVALTLLRDAIADCSQDHVFAKSLRSVRTAAETELDELLNLLPHIRRLQETGMGRFLEKILSRFSTQRDRTQFGLMNAVTSVARDTSDPDDRWQLEAIGGAIGAGLRPKRPSNAPGKKLAQPVSGESDYLSQLAKRLQRVDARAVAVAEVD